MTLEHITESLLDVDLIDGGYVILPEDGSDEPLVDLAGFDAEATIQAFAGTEEATIVLPRYAADFEVVYLWLEGEDRPYDAPWREQIEPWTDVRFRLHASSRLVVADLDREPAWVLTQGPGSFELTIGCRFLEAARMVQNFIKIRAV